MGTGHRDSPLGIEVETASRTATRRIPYTASLRPFLEQRMACRHGHLLSVSDFKIDVNPRLCGTSEEITMFFEVEGHSLQDEITGAATGGRALAEERVWGLLASTVAGLSFLFERLHSTHGMLTTRTIASSPQGYKVYDPILLCGSSPALHEQHSNFSPEQFRRSSSTPTQQSKTDVFALGIILLQACLLNRFLTVHDRDLLVVNEKDLAENLARLRATRSSILADLVSTMLECDP